MESIVTQIAAYIETWAYANVDMSPLSLKNWGFCELMNRVSKSIKSTSTQPIPMTINGTGQREQVAIDDRYDFIEWIRLNSPMQIVHDESDSWGLREGKRHHLSMRIVIAHKVELGEDLVYLMISEMLDDLRTLKSEANIESDHATIYNTELGATVYEQHRFNWNLYVINLDIEYIPCRTADVPIVDDPGGFDYVFDFGFN